ncbi:hypothetical protein HYV89_03525 [Candidatus Woesearchaeota archaeon]|nr:hypothetical protein [Candidatus Woesearchaeota archaeon]
MLYFLFGSKSKSVKKEPSFRIKPNELEDLANFGDALHGKFKMLAKELKLDKKNKRIKEISDGFIVLCRKLDSMAKRST